MQGITVRCWKSQRFILISVSRRLNLLDLIWKTRSCVRLMASISQGSILEPIPFSTFVNYLMAYSRNYFSHLNADDSNVLLGPSIFGENLAQWSTLSPSVNTLKLNLAKLNKNCCIFYGLLFSSLFLMQSLIEF